MIDIDSEAKKYYNSLIAMPPSDKHMAEFARNMISKLKEEVLDNTTSVSWSCGFDSVVFVSRRTEKKNIEQIMEEILERGHKESNTDESS